MFKRSCICMSILLIGFAAFGCSGSSNSIVPDTTPTVEAAGHGSHNLWGLWQFTADPVKGTLDITQLRGGNMHLNALPFLEPPPLVNLTLESLEFNGNIIEADIGLRHPFLGLNEFSGFDVCGIFITNGEVTGFSNPDLRMAGDGDTRLLNPDGYSRWWNPSEFPVNTGTMFGYNDGLLGTPDSFANYDCTLNGYKFFCDDLANPNSPLSDVTIEGRALFSAGKKNIRHYTIELGDDGLIFNYAVDASWEFPQGPYPWEVPDDFGPAANRPEAWWISVTELENTLYNDGVEFGGDLSLMIDVYDHFNADLNNVRIEAPGEIPATESNLPTGSGDGYSTYQIDITDCTPVASGSLELLVTIESDVAGYGSNLPGEPVSAYFIHKATVDDEPPVTDPWSEEFEIVDSGGRFPVIAQTTSDRIVAAWSTNPGVSWSEFTFPDTWATPGVVDSIIDAIRMSIEPGITGDDILITTQKYGGTMNILGVPTEFGHPLLYMWDGASSWDQWDTPLIGNQLMHHTMIDFQGKYQWFWGTRASYGHPVHTQFSNWEQNSWYDYVPNYYFFGYPNSSELGYSRCWDDDSSGNAYIVYEYDRLKTVYGTPVDYRGVVVCKQFLPSMSNVDAEYIVEYTGNDHCDSPSFAFDSTNRAHLAYRRSIDSTGEWQVVHRWSNGGSSWSSMNETIVWSGSLEPEWRYISLDVDSQDRIHLTFRVDREIWYTRSDDGIDWLELEWVNESIEDLMGVGDHQQWMFVDADDQAHVVWARIPVGPGSEYGSLWHRWRQATP